MMRVCLALMVSLTALPVVAAEISTPRVTDSRLEISLVASEPQVVTPVALEADAHGNLYVLETNTHARNSNYDGPESDRIFRFSDTTGDGQLDRQQVCASGLRNALSMALTPDGRLFVLQMKSVLVLQDKDGDGTFETRETILTVKTENNNHHGVLLALAADDRGRLFVTLGNIGGSVYEIRGTGDTFVSGQGDTGLIVRLNDDGTDLLRYAHGFWNPCDLTFDSMGRLLATDNDPDARGPNRVLHVIEGGRYGYKSRFGVSGLHPYDAWDGELPGTLPMVAGVGEAPVGLFDCDRSSLPADYDGNLLVAVWGTNRVDRIRTSMAGVSLRGDVEPLIVGGRNFRPTGIAATTDGTVYIADWADRRYPVHGKGRIWRLSVRASETSRLAPMGAFSKRGQGDTASGQLRLEGLATNEDEPNLDKLLKIATASDPFLASAAVVALGKRGDHQDLIAQLGRSDAQIRLAALLGLRAAGVKLKPDSISGLLGDPDPSVRRMAMVWMGETMRWDLADTLAKSVSHQTSSPALFETFLATSQLLSAEEFQRVKDAQRGSKVVRGFDQDLIRAVVADASQTSALRAMAIRYMSDDGGEGASELLKGLVRAKDVDLAREAVRKLGRLKLGPPIETLLSLARDQTVDSQLRADALMSLGMAELATLPDLVELANDKEIPVALAAVRALGTSGSHPSAKQELMELRHRLTADPGSRRLARQLTFALEDSTESDRPRSDAEWEDAMHGGDREAGRRIFFHQRSSCAKCHRIEGRGGEFGPDLTNVAASKTPKQILHSILHPSEERSPDYQGYAVVMQDGQIHTGTQFHFRGESAQLLMIDGSWIRFDLDDTEEYRALDVSLMPERLEEQLSVDEIRDLVAFLSSQ